MKDAAAGAYGRSRWISFVFVCLAWLFVGCIVIQTFLAGAAIFDDPGRWSDHAAFVHLFEFVPILMLLFAFIGRLPNKVRWQTAALFVLIFAQYFTSHVQIAGALHPVLALVLFWLSLSVARQTARWTAAVGKGESR
ncbi:DUF6220 domain-containing protein [Paenibacillus mendelii]|uniref:DUF6220 domain-containing protein n=1 Tax=Paenibacillus mendelii TaxID=206163 RepID=A0ABV6JDQ8_9BACL|nr:DUF6220 domain-containing protein [Paenibacillus mendelii]MCQ6561594.1 DUF6220 domain-containing protein [Paenibacillus mendelii]